MDFFQELLGPAIEGDPTILDHVGGNEDDSPRPGSDFNWQTVDSATKVHFDAGRKNAWKIAQDEINFLKNKAGDIFGTLSPTVPVLFDHYFGPEAPIFQCFQRYTGVEYKMFLRTLALLVATMCLRRWNMLSFGIKLVTYRTLANELNRQQAAGQEYRGQFMEIDAESPQFGSFLKCSHEAIQILHHAFTYGSDRTLFVVGNRKGDIEAGMWVGFSKELLDAYSKVLDDLYGQSLRWMYEDVPMPSRDDLKLEIQANRKLNLDPDTFYDWTSLCKSLSNEIGYPLPRVERILPLIFSIWNALKSGSDTISKLISPHLPYNIPSNEPQASAVARSVVFMAVVMHRLVQIGGSKDDLSKYPSLRHFRQAANKRQSFKATMKDLCEHIQNLLDLNEPTKSGPTGHELASTWRTRRLANETECPITAHSTTPQHHRKRSRAMLSRDAVEPRELNDIFRTGIPEVDERENKCTGFPLYCVGVENPDGKQSHKGAGRNWWCRGCHHYFCFRKDNGIDGEAKWIKVVAKRAWKQSLKR